MDWNVCLLFDVASAGRSFVFINQESKTNFAICSRSKWRTRARLRPRHSTRLTHAVHNNFLHGRPKTEKKKSTEKRDGNKCFRSTCFYCLWLFLFLHLIYIRSHGIEILESVLRGRSAWQRTTYVCLSQPTSFCRQHIKLFGARCHICWGICGWARHSLPLSM